MPKPMVTQTRLDPSAVVTMSFALDVQVGRDPGAPGAIRFGMMCQSTAIGLVEYRPVVHRFVGRAMRESRFIFAGRKTEIGFCEGPGPGAHRHQAAYGASSRRSAASSFINRFR